VCPQLLNHWVRVKEAPWHVRYSTPRRRTAHTGHTTLECSFSFPERQPPLFPELTRPFIQTSSTMWLPTILGAAALASLSLLTSPAAATALTYKLAPNEKQCFYSTADKKGSKVAFYFAVCFFSMAPKCFPSRS